MNRYPNPTGADWKDVETQRVINKKFLTALGELSAAVLIVVILWLVITVASA